MYGIFDTPKSKNQEKKNKKQILEKRFIVEAQQQQQPTCFEPQERYASSVASLRH
jgi:hypothetical protein